MNFNDFVASLKTVEDEVKSRAGSVFSTLDRWSYGMMVNCLKSEDPMAVKNAIDQMVKEKKSVAIPPLYLVSVAHPSDWVRQQAVAALPKLIPAADLKKLTEGKETKQAVSALIEKYGHFRA